MKQYFITIEKKTVVHYNIVSIECSLLGHCHILGNLGILYQPITVAMVVEILFFLSLILQNCGL